MNVVYNARIFLIRFAKIFPFVLCGIICLSYVESIFALYCENYVELDDCVVLDKPISRFVGNWFVYDWYTIAIAAIFSCAFETCWYNKACIIFACINAWERDYFLTLELYPEYIYIICAINIAICSFLCYKGIKQLLQ